MNVPKKSAENWTAKGYEEPKGSFELLSEWAITKPTRKASKSSGKKYFELARSLLLLYRKHSTSGKVFNVEKAVRKQFKLPAKCDAEFAAEGADSTAEELVFLLACAAVVRSKKGGACLAKFALRRRDPNRISEKLKKLLHGEKIPQGAFDPAVIELSDDEEDAD